MLRKKLTPIVAAITVMTGVAAATPALAQDGDYRSAALFVDRGDGFDRAADPYGYQRYGGRFEDVRYRRYGYRHREYRRRCSGTTGAIIGGVAGGLLGREIGRGGRWNEPSTTGLIIGAGAGALAGRAIERENCR